MSIGLIELFITVLSLSIGLYYYLTSTYNFWTSKGINGPKPQILFGNTKDFATRKSSFPVWIKDLYDKYRDEPMFGIYTRREPVLVLNDMELIKTILIRDFNNFPNRVPEPDIHDPLSFHLVQLDAKKWRPLRLKLSPVFTPGKISEMFYLMNECADRLEKYLDGFDGQCIDIREIAAKFTTDVIGSCVFGLDIDALENEDSVFRKMGKRALEIDWRVTLKMRVAVYTPALYKYIGSWLVDKTLANFFITFMRDTMKYREENNVIRHDFVDLIKALRDETSKSDDIELTDELMAAQFFVFFVAGFEPPSLTVSNCLFELAMNEKIQAELREEILHELAKTDDKITFAGIRRMKYLDKVVKETLRKYPPAPLVSRKATAAYTFPGTNITIPANAKIFIPIYGIQHDPKYFPEPGTFNPENFSEEAINSRPQMTFLSYGDGPRNCIGERFGSMLAKLGIVKILQKFSVQVCEKTDKEYKIDVKSFFLRPAGGIFMKISKCASKSLH